MISESLHQQAQRLNALLEKMETPQERLRYVLTQLDNREKIVLTTSFGMHSALMLHLVTKASQECARRGKVVQPVPVVWIDTGYLPSETYEFASRVSSHLSLDLRVYQSDMSPARMEAVHGKLWEDESPEAHKKYNFIRKVEPMQRALKEIGATVVLSGLRGGQTSHRSAMKMVHVHQGRLKVCPVLDWTEEQASDFFAQHKLPYHPLRKQGYVSVGDWHSSSPFDESIHKSERDTRFHGRTQECGLHLADAEPSDSFPSPLRSIPPRPVPKRAISKRGMMVSISFSSSASTATTLTEGDEDDGFVLFTKPNCRFCKAAKALLKHLRTDEEEGRLQVSDKMGDEIRRMVDHSEADVPPLAAPLSSCSTFDIAEEITVGEDIQAGDELSQELGGRVVKTVPQILYKGDYIGGYEDLVRWVKKSFPDYDNLPDTVQLAEQFRNLNTDSQHGNA